MTLMLLVKKIYHISKQVLDLREFVNNFVVVSESQMKNVPVRYMKPVSYWEEFTINRVGFERT